jgi:hypothetical protein
VLTGQGLRFGPAGVICRKSLVDKDLRLIQFFLTYVDTRVYCVCRSM